MVLKTKRPPINSTSLLPVPSPKVDLPIAEQPTGILAAFPSSSPSPKVDLPITEQPTGILAHSPRHLLLFLYLNIRIERP